MHFNLSGFKDDIQEHFISEASHKMEMDASVINGSIALDGILKI